MPTEVTTEMKDTLSQVAGKSRVQRAQVIEANTGVARQGLSGNGQNMPATTESSQPSDQQLADAAETMNKQAQNLKRELHFSINEDTGETVIKVVDSQNQKLIRTIPSDEFLDLQQQFNESIGVLLNASV
jgi:flagellar protein FlaG